MTEPVITVERLYKFFDNKKPSGNWFKDIFTPEYKKISAIRGINLEVKRGESIAFLGLNGAGKTTTTKVLCGLIHPSRGKVRVLGHEPFKRDHDFLKRIGLVMGNRSALNWDLTPLQSFELIKYIYQISPGDFTDRIEILGKMLRVEKLMNTQVRKLSLGERMKVELMASILHDPEIMFLDEPTIGLDVVSRERVRHFLRDIQEKFKTTMILTSHDMGDVEQVCDRAVLMNKGKIVFDGALKDLVESYSEGRFVKFTFTNLPSKKELEKLLTKEQANLVETNSNTHTIQTNSRNLSKVLTKVSTKFNPVDIDIISAPLEKIISDRLQE